MDRVTALGRHDDWTGVRAVVAGFDVSGAAAVDNLLHLGADVHAVAEAVAPSQLERAELLEVLGARIDIHDGATAALPGSDEDGGVDLLVVSPDVAPGAPIIGAARAAGIPVWGEVELAWRLRDPEHAAPWLCVAGTDAATPALMLDSILRAAGLRSIAAGSAGLPLTEVVMDPEPWDVIAVGLSSLQLLHTETVAAESAAVIDVAEEQARDLGRIYQGVERACVYSLAVPRTEDLVREADVVEGARAIGLTLGVPGVGMLGMVDDILVDRAFIEQRSTSAAELCTLEDLASNDPGFVSGALAAAALARAHGVGQAAVRDGLRSFRPGG